VVLPLIVLVLMNFVFSTFDNGTSPAITQQTYLMNCPLPIQNQLVNMTAPSAPNIVGTTVTYQVLFPAQVGNTTNTGTFFNCYIIPSTGLLGLNVNNPARNYGATVLDFPTGWFSWIGDTISAIFQKTWASINLGYLYLTIPAVVTGIVWYNLITGLLIMFFVLGIVLIVRSGGLG